MAKHRLGRQEGGKPRKGRYIPLRRIKKVEPPCNLKCVTGSHIKKEIRRELELSRKPIEFEGTVKIKLVDRMPMQKYSGRKLLAGLYVLSYMLMGMVVMNLFYYTLRFYHHHSINAHVILCGCGFYFALPSAYMTKNRSALPGYFLTEVGRGAQGVLLRALGVFCIAVGYSIFYYWSFIMDYNFECVHSISGFLAFAAATTEAVLFGIKLSVGGSEGILLKYAMTWLRVIAMTGALLCHRKLTARKTYLSMWTRPEVAYLIQDFIVYITLTAIFYDVANACTSAVRMYKYMECKFQSLATPKCQDPCIGTVEKSKEFYDSLLREDV